MNFLLHLRETAKTCAKPEVAKLLRDAADDLDIKLTAAYRDPTKERMVALNGAWVFATRVLKNAPPLGGDGTTGGAVPLDEQQRMAA